MAQVPYAFVIGGVMYAMVCMQPDIALAIGILS